MSACASVMRRNLHVSSFRCVGSTDGTVMSACARQCIANCVTINLHCIVINFRSCMSRRDHRKLHKISFRCCTSRREPHKCMRASATHRKVHAIKFRCVRPSSVHARIGDTSQAARDQFPMHCESKSDLHKCMRTSAARHIASCMRSISDALRVRA